MRIVRNTYVRILVWSLDYRIAVVGFATGLVIVTFVALQYLGGEFMPALEEGNLWVRATMPIDISFDQADRLTGDIRREFRQSPEVDTIVSQLGRPDDGTDPTSFFNGEFLANLKPRSEWRPGLTKDDLIKKLKVG